MHLFTVTNKWIQITYIYIYIYIYDKPGTTNCDRQGRVFS